MAIASKSSETTLRVLDVISLLFFQFTDWFPCYTVLVSFVFVFFMHTHILIARVNQNLFSTSLSCNVMNSWGESTQIIVGGGVYLYNKLAYLTSGLRKFSCVANCKIRRYVGIAGEMLDKVSILGSLSLSM